MRSIEVPWECVSDGKTRQGANLGHLLEQLLSSGYSLDVEMPSGAERTVFKTVEEFRTWFASLE